MSLKILLIEDNDDDAIIIKRALKKGLLSSDILQLINGKEALESFFDNKLEIELILLDLNMEVMNGFEFLKKRQEEKTLLKIPTIVLTSSNRPEDINKAYGLGCNAYVQKPLDPNEFIDNIIKIEKYYIEFYKRLKQDSKNDSGIRENEKDKIIIN